MPNARAVQWDWFGVGIEIGWMITLSLRQWNEVFFKAKTQNGNANCLKQRVSIYSKSPSMVSVNCFMFIKYV